jgi:hypothetical protein
MPHTYMWPEAGDVDVRKQQLVSKVQCRDKLPAAAYTKMECHSVSPPADRSRHMGVRSLACTASGQIWARSGRALQQHPQRHQQQHAVGIVMGSWHDSEHLSSVQSSKGSNVFEAALLFHKKGPSLQSGSTVCCCAHRVEHFCAAEEDHLHIAGFRTRSGYQRGCGYTTYTPTGSPAARPAWIEVHSQWIW